MMHMSGHIIQDQVERYERREPQTMEALRELKRLTAEMKYALLRRELGDFGALLHQEWEPKKKISSKISGTQLGALYDTAREHGALGGKVTGAGGGGYTLLYCRPGRRHIVAEKLKESGCIITDFSLEPLGLQTWRVSNHA